MNPKLNKITAMAQTGAQSVFTSDVVVRFMPTLPGGAGAEPTAG